MPWPIRLFEPAGLYQLILRRWKRAVPEQDAPCRRGKNPSDTCECIHLVGDPEWQTQGMAVLHIAEEAKELDHAKHWPTRCSRCKYKFVDTDYWQEIWTELYHCRETGEKTRINFIERAELPAGACWHAPWLEPLCPNNKDQPYWPLVVVTPGGFEWAVDSTPTSGGSMWRRKGLHDVDGSIVVPGFHGVIGKGLLLEV